MPDFFAFARELSVAARRETLRDLSITSGLEDKNPGGPFDPVSNADREAERAMRDLIVEAFPDHGILGEEFDNRAGASAYQWSLDPIDGTRSYISGLPTWTTLIALMENGRPIMGLIDAPCLDELYVGFHETSWKEAAGVRTPIRVSKVGELGEARLATTDPLLFKGNAAAAFKTLYGATRITRFGYDAYAYARLASGTIDLVVECELKPHDYQALIPVVRGAGGTFGDWSGGTDFSAGQVIGAATRELYVAAVEVMRAAASSVPLAKDAD
jgi:histidinol phosphatase-like enzyme (inositol monophosphatase family)